MLRVQALRLLLLSAVILFCVSQQLHASPPLPVEGDRELLKFLYDAQVSNLGLYPRGKLSAHCEHYQELGLHWEGDVELEWDGGQTYYHLNYRNRKEEKFRVAEFVELSDRAFAFSNGASGPRLSRFSAMAQRVTPEVARLRPQDGWHLPLMRPDFSEFAEYLDEDCKGEIYAVVGKFVVVQEGDIVRVERHTEGGWIFEMTINLAANANIVKYHQSNPGEAAGLFNPMNGTFDWADDGHGGFYMKRHEWSLGPGNWEESPQHGRIEVSFFDPNPKIAADRFTEAAFKLPPGTTVVEHVGNSQKQFRLGDPPPEDDDARLQRVSEELKSDGFAKPR